MCTDISFQLASLLKIQAKLSGTVNQHCQTEINGSKHERGPLQEPRRSWDGKCGLSRKCEHWACPAHFAATGWQEMEIQFPMKKITWGIYTIIYVYRFPWVTHFCVWFFSPFLHKVVAAWGPDKFSKVNYCWTLDRASITCFHPSHWWKPLEIISSHIYFIFSFN